MNETLSLQNQLKDHILCACLQILSGYRSGEFVTLNIKHASRIHTIFGWSLNTMLNHTSQKNLHFFRLSQSAKRLFLHM